MSESNRLLEMGSDRFARDLVALTALPTAWKGYEPARIAESAASALTPMLGADFVYIGSYRDERVEDIDVIVATEQMKGDDLDAIAAALWISIRQGDADWGVTTPDSPRCGQFRLGIAPLGSEGRGVIVAGAQEAQFPSATQRVLLATAASAWSKNHPTSSR